MSRYCSGRDLDPILKAAQSWKEKCLLGGDSVFEDKSLFGDESFWSVENAKELFRLSHLYYSDAELWVEPAGFAEALLSLCNESERKASLAKLIAEMYWVLYLSPCKLIKTETKRNRIRDAWRLSAEELDKSHYYLSEEILSGAGNPGAKFNIEFWREFRYFITILVEFLPLANDDKQDLLSDGWKFSEWLKNIPDGKSTQFRHMLLFLLFPDKFERVFSDKDRKNIATAFNPNLQGIEAMSPNDLDKLLFETRQQQEASRGQPIDWYEDSIQSEWKIKSGISSENQDHENDSDILENDTETTVSGIARNVVFYGPPGTGKTYKLNALKSKYTTKEVYASDSDRVEEILKPLTWWQVAALVLAQLDKAVEVSELARHEWVGVKSRLTPSNDNVTPTLWSALLGRFPDAKKPTHPIIFSRVQNRRKKWEWKLSEDWENDVPEITDKLKQLRGEPNAPAMGDIHRYEYVTFHQSYGYEDFVEGIRPVQDEDGHEVKYRVEPGIFKLICSRAKSDLGRRYAIFIDEINRGKISKIFGELITLLEPDKRAHYSKDGVLEKGMELTLPYSKEPFGVPANLDVYATMNTADRSIVLMDTALRRRFQFEELMPDPKVIEGESGNGTIDDGEGGRIDLRKLLKAINKRIRFLCDRDHMIGHSYFTEVRSFEHLQEVFSLKILPLLQEYFYEDWRRIQIVFRDIGDDGQPCEHQIVLGRKVRELDVIGFDHDDYEDQVDYSVNKISSAAIRKIYE